MNINRIAVLIKKASIEFDKLSNPILSKYDLTASQCRVLKFLYSEKTGSARVVDIEKECAITHPTVLGLLGSLEIKGFVTRIINPEDARSKLISLTKKALDMQPELEGVVEEIDDMLTDNLSGKERKQLAVLLRKLLKAETEEKSRKNIVTAGRNYKN